MARQFLPWLAAFALLASASASADVASADAVERPEDRAAAATVPSDEDSPREDESEEDAENRRIVERLQREHAAEQASVAAIREAAAFREVRAIEPPAGSGKVLAFHPLADGGLVVATGADQGYGERSVAQALASIIGAAGGNQPAPPANGVAWLDADGTQKRSAPLPFTAKGVTIAPDGAVIVVGGDKVMVFSPAGEPLAEAEAPHFSPTENELAALREEITEQHREQLEAVRQNYDQVVAAKAELEQVPEEQRTRRQKKELADAEQRIRSFEPYIEHLTAASGDVVATSLAEARTIHRVAASRDHLFLVAKEPVGHGFGVWRCGRDFSAAEKIIDGLSGCCGQMDVQVIGDDLVIAENARHHVAVYGHDGEPRRTFGEGSRTDVRKGFGGCCNPMNACAGPDGTLLLSESNGLVKQFAPDGTLVEILAAANVQPGCKNSSIGISADGIRLYYLDIEKGRVLVLEKRS